MYCEQCGKEIKDGSGFCMYCGAKAEEAIIGKTADVQEGSGDFQAVLQENVLETGDIGKSEEKAEKKKSKRGLIMAIAAAAVIALAVFIGASIYNKPENRLARALDLGYKYLEDQQYEEAAVAFEMAITIDERCVEAYAKGLEAYQHADNTESMESLYDKAIDLTEELEEEKLAENMEYVVEIYLSTEAVYGEKPEKAVAFLEQGYQLTEENKKIRNALVDAYFSVVEKRAEDKEYEENLAAIDRMLELDADNEKVVESLEKVLKEYLDILLEKKDYDKISELAEKYRDIAEGIDFEIYLPTPFVEKNSLAFEEKLEDMDLPYLIAYVEDLESGKVTDLGGGWIESGEMHYAFSEITSRPSEQAGYIDVILSVMATYAPIFYVPDAQGFFYRLTWSGFSIGDYYTGLCLPERSLYGNGVSETQKDFEWRGESYSISAVMSQEMLENNWSEWEYYGQDDIYYCTNQFGGSTTVYTITIPEGYDGLVLRFRKSKPEEFPEQKSDADITDEEEEEYLWDTESTGEYVYYRLSDLLKKG